MLHNKSAMYLFFHLLKSDVKAHDILYSESRMFAWLTYKLVHKHILSNGELLFRYEYMTVHYENTYDVQLSFQMLFSQWHIRSFKISAAAVDWLIILGCILYVCH